MTAAATQQATDTVLAIGDWPTNAHLIADAARLGYIGDIVLDPTWGEGNFWTIFRPQHLYGSDIDPAKSPDGTSHDATNLAWPTNSFDTVVCDGPFKLNGRPDPAVDNRYGVGRRATVAERHQLLGLMLTEAARVTRPGGTVLFKCQDQVNGGRVRWQTRLFADHGETVGLTHIDSMLFRSWREQPARATCTRCQRKVMRRSDGRWGTVPTRPDSFACGTLGLDVPHLVESHDTQEHAGRNYSTLLIFRVDGR